MTTIQTWIDRCREHLVAGQVDVVNRLAESYGPGDEQLTFQYDLKGMAQGTALSCGRAAFMVWAAEANAKRVTVSPGWAGALDVAIPAGTMVRVKPRFYDHLIFDSINDTLSELSSPDLGLFAVDQITIDYSPAQSVYDLADADDLESILSVSCVNPIDTTSRWPMLGANQYELRFIEPTAQFPSGKQLRINYWPNISADENTLVVTYRKAFTKPGDVDVDVDTVGLPDTAYDLPALGAAVKLSVGLESRRVSPNSQGDTRRPDEVPVGASVNATRALNAQYRQRVTQEYARLVRMYGVNFK